MSTGPVTPMWGKTNQGTNQRRLSICARIASVATLNVKWLGGSLAWSVDSRRCLRVTVLAAALFVSVLSPWASAAFMFSGNSADGHPVSGMAEFTLDAGADSITVQLTNTTAITRDAGELLTGLDFSLGGLTPSLVSDTGIRRTVADDASFVDTLTAQDLNWSLASLGFGSFQLNFHPNAKDSIIGPPVAGSYGSANPSIRGNPGHNPFVAETAVFVLHVPNLEAS